MIIADGFLKPEFGYLHSLHCFGINGLERQNVQYNAPHSIFAHSSGLFTISMKMNYKREGSTLAKSADEILI